MNLFGNMRARIGVARCNQRYQRAFERFREFTMLSEEDFTDNLRLAERVRGIDGCVIECGVWRGGMIAGLSLVLGANRNYFLLDSFKGLPPAAAIDGPAARAWQKNTADPNYYDNCSAPPEWAGKAMFKAGVSSYKLIEGWFEQTLPQFTPPDQIALLRLDADWYESTMVCLTHLFDQVAPGGLIMLDDYYTWDGCSRALHDFLSQRSAVERIHSLGRGSTCYLVKR